MIRHAIIYQFTGPTPALAALEQAAAAHPARAPGPPEPSTIGFGPLPSGDQLRHVAGLIALSVRQERRLVPSYAIASRLTAASREVEVATGQPLKGLALRAARQEIYTALLAQALTTATSCLLVIDPTAGWLLVATPSRQRAEAAVSLLRHALDSLPVRPWVKDPAVLAQTMAAWIAGQARPAELSLDDDVQWSDASGQVRARGEIDLAELCATQHGRLPAHLRVTWNEVVTFTLYADGRLGRLDFAPGLDSEAPAFDADLTLEGGSLRDVLDGLSAHVPGDAP
ncbi:recombination-associated protein RdgC [uncultured Thiodictyon sp.]|uniref:recombination-associated protein RdgC n=1 Tax=uncultured Thiodictyon sp. TaxID=1846217 RepID=UPI0025D1AB0D|nr:recombination-associated protein RdgC [uncultured Thiodictyon sp.]